MDMRLYIVCNVIPVELIIEKSVIQTGRESFTIRSDMQHCSIRRVQQFSNSQTNVVR